VSAPAPRSLQRTGVDAAAVQLLDCWGEACNREEAAGEFAARTGGDVYVHPREPAGGGDRSGGGVAGGGGGPSAGGDAGAGPDVDPGPSAGAQVPLPGAPGPTAAGPSGAADGRAAKRRRDDNGGGGGSGGSEAPRAAAAALQAPPSQLQAAPPSQGQAQGPGSVTYDRNNQRVVPPPDEAEPRFVFTLQPEGAGPGCTVAMRPSQTLRRVRNVAASRFWGGGAAPEDVVLTFAGHEVEDEDTPAGLGLRAGAVVGARMLPGV
jgi:hypothetical protein